MIVMVGFNPASEPRFQARTSSQRWCPRRPGATEHALWLQRALRSATPDLFGLNFLGRLLCPWRKDSVKGWRPVRLKKAISEYVQLGSHRLPEHRNELPHAKCNWRSGPQNGLRVSKKNHIFDLPKNIEHAHDSPLQAFLLWHLHQRLEKQSAPGNYPFHMSGADGFTTR